MIKDQMDKKFGSPWHVIVGKAFAYEITYEVRAAVRASVWCSRQHAGSVAVGDTSSSGHHISGTHAMHRPSACLRLLCTCRAVLRPAVLATAAQHTVPVCGRDDGRVAVEDVMTAASLRVGGRVVRITPASCCGCACARLRLVCSVSKGLTVWRNAGCSRQHVISDGTVEHVDHVCTTLP
jgi:hypothetical protein